MGGYVIIFIKIHYNFENNVLNGAYVIKVLNTDLINLINYPI